MDDHPDPLLNFFTQAEADSSPPVLYTALSLEPTASAEEVRKAYRRLALRYHPDKHANKSEAERKDAEAAFQRVGFAYAVLSDEAKRKRYDATGRTDEGGFGVGDEGWEAYFESLFKRVDRKMLDEHKAGYQGSAEETDDLVEAYRTTGGSLPDILDHIPHSGPADEGRFVGIVDALIASGRLESSKKWTKTSRDEGAAQRRRRAAAAEAKEAEETARELGVWDEFYGSGEKGQRAAGGGGGKSKKGKGKENEGGEEDALAALILKRQRDRGSALEALEDKYRRIEAERQAKKAKKGKGGKGRPGEPPELDDEAFEKLQREMFAGKGARGKQGKA